MALLSLWRAVQACDTVHQYAPSVTEWKSSLCSSRFLPCGPGAPKNLSHPSQVTPLLSTSFSISVTVRRACFLLSSAVYLSIKKSAGESRDMPSSSACCGIWRLSYKFQLTELLSIALHIRDLSGPVDWRCGPYSLGHQFQVRRNNKRNLPPCAGFHYDEANEQAF